MQKLTRAAAKAQGLTRYFTGKPCKHGHVEERMVSNGACMACHKARRRDWEARNPEKSLACSMRWKMANPEKVKITNAKSRIKNAASHAEKQRLYRANNLEKDIARQARWLAANKPKMRAINAAWYEKNRHIVATRDARRRTSEAQAMPGWDRELTELATKEAADLAKLREAATDTMWHIDHMIPLKAKIASGLHVWSNLQVIPAQMNLSKNNDMVLTEPGAWIRHL